MYTPTHIPPDIDLRAIPRWARVALAIRTVRRIEPLLLASWPEATQAFMARVEEALAEAERAAAQGSLTADLKDAGMAAVKVCGTQPLSATAAYYVAYAAGHCCFSAQKIVGVDHVQFVLDEVFWAVVSFEANRKTKTFKDTAMTALRLDYEKLKTVSECDKWTNRTPVTMDIFGTMWPDSPPQNWPAAVAVPTPVLPKQTHCMPALGEFSLPAELVVFLRDERQLEFDPSVTEVGPVRLKPLEYLRIEEFTVTTKDTPLERKDPHRNDRGYYFLRVVDLIGEAELYGPDGLLAWFCDYGCFGTWDCDHQIALGFPHVSWADIVADPGKYLDAQWQPECSFAQRIEPWKHCDFRFK